MTRMTGPDCAVMCNLINTHTHTNTSIKTLARPPRAPWEKAPARPPKPEKYDNEERCGGVKGSAGKWRHCIC